MELLHAYGSLSVLCITSVVHSQTAWIYEQEESSEGGGVLSLPDEDYEGTVVKMLGFF